LEGAIINIKNDKGWDIPIHVDGASGGFIAPIPLP
jgi:glutamate decarboxylase